jgi:hypothetical protein
VLLLSEAFYVQRKAYNWILTFKSGAVKEILSIFNQSKNRIIILASSFSVLSFLSCFSLNVYLKLSLLQNIITYFFLILSSFFATVSLVDYYFLFAKKQDLQIFRFNMLASIAGLLFLLVLTPCFGCAGCGLAFLVMSFLNFNLRRQETKKWI